MAHVIAVNAFHPGSGASTTAANMAAVLALQGLQVGVVDACLTAPTLHLLFGLPSIASQPTLNDHLLGRCSLAAAAQRVPLHSQTAERLSVVVVPADPNPATVAKIHHLPYALDTLGAGCQQLALHLGLDVLIVDTETGLPASTLDVLATASAVLVVLELDKQQYQGVARTVAVAEALHIPRRKIAINAVVPLLDYDDVAANVAHTYGWEVAAVIPYCDELMSLASASLFTLRYPTHPVTAIFHQIAASLL